MNRLLVLLLAYPFAATHGQTNKVEDAYYTAQEKVLEETDNLNNLRDRIAEKRKPLADRLETLRREVLVKRREHEHLRIGQSEDAAEAEALYRDVNRLRDSFEFQRTLLVDYRRSFETRLSAAESETLQERLSGIDAELATVESPEGFLGSAKSLLELTETWNKDKVGGVRVFGRCTDATGSEREGSFAILGPVSYFAGTEGEVGGLTVTSLGNSRPTLFEGLPPETVTAAKVLINGGESVLPVDPSGGDALKVASQKAS
ncbi:MAG: hypothetical protein AAF492_12445, partial [Verrucomicrobiota bacterium]